jgi:serine/threonine protein phosphatase PrpC
MEPQPDGIDMRQLACLLTRCKLAPPERSCRRWFVPDVEFAAANSARIGCVQRTIALPNRHQIGTANSTSEDIHSVPNWADLVHRCMSNIAVNSAQSFERLCFRLTTHRRLISRAAAGFVPSAPPPPAACVHRRLVRAMLSRLTRVLATKTNSTKRMATSAGSAHAHADPTAASASAAWRRRLTVLGLGATVGAGVVALAESSASLSTASCAAASHSNWPPPILSTSRVYAGLASPAETITPVRRGLVKEVHVNQYAANPVIEDTVAVVPAVQCPPGGIMLGVFDGHSGKEASKWCSEELLPYLQYFRWSNRTDQLIHKRTFIEADSHFLELALRDRRLAAGLSGACLNVSHISGPTVRTANAGDCRTIVGRRVPKNNQPVNEKGEQMNTEYKYQAIELTEDHQIDTNHLERQRLLRDHPDEADIILKNRVKGRLQPTRGFGDGFYKRKEFYNARTLNKPYAVWTPPYTTVEPDITSYELREEDEFMVMASDGLFQDLNSQQGTFCSRE